MRAMTRSPCRRVPRRLSAVAERHLRESGGPTGGTTGGYIDSFENMPGDQPIDERRPTVTDLKRDPRERRHATGDDT